jgi:ABC-2 type transport system ATP-binding protein
MSPSQTLAVPADSITRDTDPRHVYHNVIIANDAARTLNNGHPSTLALCRLRVLWINRASAHRLARRDAVCDVRERRDDRYLCRSSEARLGYPMTVAAVQTNVLTRQFGAITAVDSMTLEVPAGIIFGFLGPNGSGKTTAIRLLLGLTRPSSGSAHIFGFDSVTEGENVRAHCGALLEHTGLYERLSAEDNLDYYGRIWRIPQPERRERMRDLLDRFDLWERRRDRVAGWSRGMKQKLAIARALLHRPSLLFLDEPTAGLDLTSAASLRRYVASLRDLGTTVFLNTHNLHEAEELCDLVGVIRKGRLLTVARPDEIRASAAGRLAMIRGRGFASDIVAAVGAIPGIQTAELEGDTLTLRLDTNGDVSDALQLLVARGVKIDEVRNGADLEHAVLSILEMQS